MKHTNFDINTGKLTQTIISQGEEDLIKSSSATRGEQNAFIEMNRSLAYSSESDPLFFKWQRGEIEKQDWLDKVQEIKLRYPYI